MKTKLEKNQKEILNKIKKKLILDEDNSELNIFKYLSNSNKLSFCQMQFILNKKYFIKYLYLCFKNFLSFFYYYDFNLHKFNTNSKFQQIIITWGRFSDFNKKGNFFDRYCGKNSFKEKKTLWIIQYEDKVLPKKVSENVLIFQRSRFKTLHFDKFFIIFKYLKFRLSSLKSFSSNSLYALIFYKKIYDQVLSLGIKKIIIPFEGQIFQKYLIKKFKKKNLKVIGITHTFLQPIPFNFYYEKNNFPDELYVNSYSLKSCLVKHFNWKKKNILIKKSTRFSRNIKGNMDQKIFFPYEISNSKKIEKIFINFVELYKDKINLNLEIKIHPAKTQNNVHLNLKRKIINILNKNKTSQKKTNNKISIFFEYTSSIIEALERDVKVIQLCTEPILQVYTPFFYKGISFTQIKNNIIEYKKIKKNSLIKM